MFLVKMSITGASLKSSFSYLSCESFQKKVVCPTLSPVLKRNSDYCFIIGVVFVSIPTGEGTSSSLWHLDQKALIRQEIIEPMGIFFWPTSFRKGLTVLAGNFVLLVLRVRKLDQYLLSLEWLLCSFVVHLTAMHFAVSVSILGTGFVSLLASHGNGEMEPSLLEVIGKKP